LGIEEDLFVPEINRLFEYPETYYEINDEEIEAFKLE